MNLQTLRLAVADAVVRAYGAEREYSVALNATFPSFDWFSVEASDTSDEAKPVHAEKRALYEVLKAARHSNPSTVWARIRKYGREERHGKPEAEAGAEGGEGASEGAGNKPRDVVTRNVEELINLYKFNKRQESLPVKVSEAQKFIASALMALGVDLSMVGE